MTHLAILVTHLAICRPGRSETWLSRHKAVAAFLKLAGEDFRFSRFLASQVVEFGDQGPHFFAILSELSQIKAWLSFVRGLAGINLG